MMTPSTSRLTIMLASGLAAGLLAGCSQNPVPSPTPSTTSSASTASPTITVSPTTSASATTASPTNTATLPSSPTSTTSTTRPVTSSSSALPRYLLAEQRSPATANGTEFVIREVRTGRHQGYERLVIEFYHGIGELPWHTRWTNEGTTEGEGRTITMPGNATLTVRLPGMHMPFNSGITVLTGDQKTAAGVIRGAWIDPPFEAQGQVFIGIDRQRPYRAYVLDNPVRLVIDVRTT